MTFIDLLNNYHSFNKGGKGDNLSPFDVNKNELIVGLYVEREHTNNPFLSIAIALDHLSENPRYYTELVQSGIADEPKAIELAKKYLNVTPVDKNAVIDNPKSEDEEMTDVLLGFKPRNVGDYSNKVNENFDFVAAEIENFGNPDRKQKLIKFESYYDHWRDLSADEKNNAFALYKELNMYKYDIEC